MNVTRNQLHQLVDVVNPAEMGLVYQLLMKFVPEDDVLPDEVEAIRIAEEQIANGEVYDESAINWE